MNRWIANCFLLLILITLSACNSKAYETHLENAKDSINKEDYRKALSELEKAIEEEPSSKEAMSLYTLTMDHYYANLIHDGKVNMEKYEFTKAIAAFETAIALYEDDDVKADLKKAKSLQKKQQQLDEYVEWLEGVMKRNVTLSNVWRDSIELYSVKMTNRQTIKNELSALLPELRKMLSDAEDKSFQLDDEMGTYHTVLVQDMNRIHLSYLGVLSVLNDTESEDSVIYSNLLSQGENVNNSREMINRYIQTLKRYAEEEKIELRIKEIAY
jgi:tetratricopeptide (TPR) repeat protein